jgi:hypothetical protein
MMNYEDGYVIPFRRQCVFETFQSLSPSTTESTGRANSEQGARDVCFSVRQGGELWAIKGVRGRRWIREAFGDGASDVDVDKRSGEGQPYWVR